MWTELCDLISKNPNKIFTLNVEPIIRQGIQRYSDQVGVLWLSLAEYYNRKPNFERVCFIIAFHLLQARDIYEEAMLKVTTVRDFTRVFDAYAKFMERLTSKKLELLQNAKSSEIDVLEFELELFMNRYNHLLERRPLLLNSVLLRQNPNNVREWLNRVQLYEGFLDLQLEAFEKAVKVVDPKQQTGNLCDLWIHVAELLERQDNPSGAKAIFERAVEVPYNKVDELAKVWCKYAEFELLHV